MVETLRRPLEVINQPTEITVGEAVNRVLAANHNAETEQGREAMKNLLDVLANQPEAIDIFIADQQKPATSWEQDAKRLDQRP